MFKNITDQTLDYYNEHAKIFSDGTVDVDFSNTQEKFLSYLKPKSKILDLGCGSGRDTKYFLDKGFDVVAADGSPELVKIASEYTGINVKHMLFTELSDENTFDGIWACASILHCQKEELIEVLRRAAKALKQQGIFYVSFKYGDFEGFRNGRYFIDLNEESLGKILKEIHELSLIDLWITGDVREGREKEQWLNVLLKKWM